MSRESASSALASVVMSETTVVSRSSDADGTRRGTGGAGSDSPGTTIPPIAAGPVDGLSAVLPAASPAAEMPGFGLDTVGPSRFRTTRGWSPYEPPPGVALPRAHHLHVARPPVRVYENAARKVQRIKGRPEKRNTQSGFMPLSCIGRAGRWHHEVCNTGCNSKSIGTRFRFARTAAPRAASKKIRANRRPNRRAHGRNHKTIWYRGAATKTGIHLRRHQILRNAPQATPVAHPVGSAAISPAHNADRNSRRVQVRRFWRLEALPLGTGATSLRDSAPPQGGEPTSAAAMAATIGPRTTAKAGNR
jgi:hypothetical protein